MNPIQMLELMNRTPFEPFAIHLNNGNVIHVGQPYEIHAKANSPTCIVYDDEGVARFISYRNIAEVVTKDVNGFSS
jgi:hypothetical protein